MKDNMLFSQKKVCLERKLPCCNMMKHGQMSNRRDRGNDVVNLYLFIPNDLHFR